MVINCNRSQTLLLQLALFYVKEDRGTLQHRIGRGHSNSK